MKETGNLPPRKAMVELDQHVKQQLNEIKSHLLKNNSDKPYTASSYRAIVKQAVQELHDKLLK